MKFYTQYNNISQPSNPGEKEIQEYSREKRGDNTWKIFKTHKRNIYNEIQEAGEGIALKDMIEKYEQGYIPNLNIKPNDNYIDTTGISNNYIENHNNINNHNKMLTEINKRLKELEKQKENENSNDSQKGNKENETK